MLMRQTIETLNGLRLKPMAKALEDQNDNPSTISLSFDERIGLLVDYEKQARENAKQARLFKQAKLKVDACLEDVIYKPSRGIDRQVMAHLSTCQFIDNHLNIIITGATGVGKTWLSCAFGNAAIRKGCTVFSIRLARLLESFLIARADGTIQKYRMKLAKFDLLIIDDWGLSPLTTLARHELLELIDERCGSGAIIITSQLPVEKWHSYLDDPTVADAILDRIVQRAHRIELSGDSMRKLQESV